MRDRKAKQPYECRGQVWMIPTADIRPNPSQPRREFPLEGLVELAQSISENGVLQPLTVTLGAEGPVLIAGDRQRSVLALVENLQRENMNCFEVAEGIQRLIRDYELTQNEAAQQLGYSQSAVANKLRLLRLPEEERRRMTAAGLSERHARALLRIEDDALRGQALERIIGEHMTVARSERLVDELLAGRVRRRPAQPLVKDVRVFFNTVNHALDIMRRGGISASSQRREEADFIEYVVRIPKAGARRPAASR